MNPYTALCDDFGVYVYLNTKMELPSNRETVLHFFGQSGDGSDPYAGLIDVGGTLYGTTLNGGGTGCGGSGCGTVFSINPKTGAEAVLYAFQGGSDGANPYAGLINVKGTLYGTTRAGGMHSLGTVYSIKP